MIIYFSVSQYSSPVEALNLIVESRSLPVEVNNLTTELHLRVEAKEKFAIIDSKCGSLLEAIHSTVKSNDCMGFTQIPSPFHPWRASIRPSSPIVTLPFESKANFSSTAS